MCAITYKPQKDLDLICSLNIIQNSLILFGVGFQCCKIRQWRRKGKNLVLQHEAVLDLTAQLESCFFPPEIQHIRKSFQSKTIFYHYPHNIWIWGKHQPPLFPLLQHSVFTNLQILNIYSTIVLYLLWTTAAVRLLTEKDCALKYYKMQSSSFQGQL